MKYILKNTLFITVFMFTCSVLSLVVTLIPTTWVKLVLSIVSLIFCFLEVILFTEKLGSEGQRVKNANVQALKATLETGRKINIVKQGEYKWYYGALIGLLMCSVAILLLVIQAIVTACGGETMVLAHIVKIMYAVFACPQNSINNQISTYYILCYIPFFIGASSLGYYIGKRKVDLEQQKIQEIADKIHGVSNDDDEEVEEDK